MGDRKSEGLGVELRRRKKVDTTPIYFSSNTRVLLAPGSLAPLSGCPFRASRDRTKNPG